MDKTDRPESERALDTQFGELRFSGKEVIAARKLVKAFGEQVLLDQTDFLVLRGERVALLGRNGCGKSTLLKIVMGEEPADAGTARIGDSIRYAYLPQTVSFEDPALSILETVRNALRISEGDARGLLARYKFPGNDIHKAVGGLSGGEKSRLRLCLLMQEDVNLLLLDEPTNHLDIGSREWLEEALADFGGTILFVSHDRYFINRFATRICELEGGRLEDYYGDYEFFKQRKRERLCQAAVVSSAAAPKQKNLRNKPPKPESADRTECKVRKLEEQIQELEGKLAQLEREMQNTGGDYVRLQELLCEREEMGSRIDALYREWEKLSG